MTGTAHLNATVAYEISCSKVSYKSMTSVVYEGGDTCLFDHRRLEKFIQSLANGLDISVSDLSTALAAVETSLPATVTVNELLELIAESFAQRIVKNPDYSILSGRVETRRLLRNVITPFSANFKRLRSHRIDKSQSPRHLVSEESAKFVEAHSEYLDALICPDRDLNLTYFGIRTLCKSYLLQINDVVAETPQYLFLRVAIGLHGTLDNEESLSRIEETYNLMSQKYFIFSSPTLFNAGTENGYLSLCFLMGIQDDSIDGIFKSLHSAALILKGSGGLGIHVHDIRSRGSRIRSSNGTSNGLVPMLRVFNNTARYVDQGGNKRPGAFAIYLEPWHGDIMEVLDLRKNHGPDELRARDLFFGLWVPDLFMKRVKNNEDWSLFSPSEARGLSDVYGDDFERLYEEYEAKGLAQSTMKARKLWMHILEAQTETGMPFMLYKDACNKKLNQQNLGTIKSSNLCCEIVEYSSPEETAVCNLGLLGLPTFVRRDSSGRLTYDFAKLHEVTKILARNLDRVIDVTEYPIENARKSNLKHRPIAIGVQGLADTFLELRLAFDSSEARALNSQIFETIYHAAVESSIEMAIKSGSYESFPGSPASNGKLQFDLWGHEPEFFDDWDEIKEKVKKHGLRNSLLVAPMPTASTSQIMGFNECFEPFTSNLYTRRVLSGEYQVVNKYLVKDLIALGIWNRALQEKIMTDNGLIQHIEVIPQDLKDLYKTVWEISQKQIVLLASERGRFIDQLQSMNIHLLNPTLGSITSCHFYAWEHGLKTGMYYLRTQAATRAIQFTIDKEKMDSELTKLEIPDTSKLERGIYAPQKKFSKRQIASSYGKSKRHRADSQKVGPISLERRELDEVFNGSYDDGQIVTKPRKKLKEVDEIYDIHDNTPLACNISDATGCEACSG